MSRYDRQMKCGAFGTRGQSALSQAVIMITGLGALGSAAAEQLARAGAGHLVLCDMDIVECSNLHRQSCYDEHDASSGALKAEALKHHLLRINSEITVTAVAEEITSLNIERLISMYHPVMMIDGTDQFSTRFLINQACHRHHIPWIYGACLGTKGTVVGIDFTGPCLSCLLSTIPETGEDCSIAGILPPVAHMTAAMQCAEVMNYMAEGRFSNQLLTFNTAVMKFQQTNAAAFADADCPICVHHQYSALAAPPAAVTKLCGGKFLVRVPVELFTDSGLSFQRTSPFFKYYQDDDYQLSLFHDGRVILTGADNTSSAETTVRQLLYR
ncbi:thiamine/molybdopterin biosynthesis protein [Macrococcus equipercicus]|uniref:Thiamine/molybdopterin biosynthesis protein n=1 Tax=Macrococcus equipercicus TaxID=69967 RepID=A0ABQ6R6J4_9STAP|nr:ThiF family adenylyltransferase [Macrococcus equipercicus]KAA1036905.1 thiamine/molybdopterin biosynthesis protein [Macrococcus equipercicus]